MPFGQVVVGSPGSGKTTYCYGLQQYFNAINRPVAIVNLDPANHSVPYDAALSLSQLITVQDVMEELQLGPNGAMLYCLEYLEANLDSWLIPNLQKMTQEYVVFDLPGQVELSTNHPSLRRILERLTRSEHYNLVALHLVDASHITDASRYISLLLLSLRAMLTLELPHINVLSKMDLLSQLSDELAFNLEFYTEVQDLSYLLPHLSASSSRAAGPSRRKYEKLNERITELIEDFGLVSFETLAVEDRDSMAHLLRVCDKATGYVYVQGEVAKAAQTMQDEDDLLVEEGDQEARRREARQGTAASAASLFTVADTGTTGLGRDRFSHAGDIQERYVDPVTSKLWREWENERWKEEGNREFERRIREEGQKVISQQQQHQNQQRRQASNGTQEQGH
ncbi:hypothetical protein OC846_004123 [Tilletia horrida]|uniref:GPN-loop GTPase 2 n=1 Tax=Tilletia horrida TaxID=155126 RepID=A0AAN6GMV3_9BASI|nr:hypothetical protein OC845_004062 [Tilletia horrida]KAK0549342.1 hypothetical protein OC846_004123 [Tilletia horrida]KAK0564464.1 hypothetical protein OC861_004275 [Tilletia horrida]